MELPELLPQHIEQGFDEGMPEVGGGAQGSDRAEEGRGLLEWFKVAQSGVGISNEGEQAIAGEEGE